MFNSDICNQIHYNETFLYFKMDSHCQCDECDWKILIEGSKFTSFNLKSSQNLISKLLLCSNRMELT